LKDEVFLAFKALPGGFFLTLATFPALVLRWFLRPFSHSSKQLIQQLLQAC